MLATASYSVVVAVRGGFEPPEPLRVRQFSKLLVSATHPPHQNPAGLAAGSAKIQILFNLQILLLWLGDVFAHFGVGLDVAELVVVHDA